MSFKSYNGGLRKIGRQIVLPVSEIKKIMQREIFDKQLVDVCVDFGAGTLFWTNWLKEKSQEIYAIDIIYENNEFIDGVRCKKSINDMGDILQENKVKMFFSSDVFHHLDDTFASSLLLGVINRYDYIVIKDIDCNKRIGNYMNRVHDRVINGEKIRDINPNRLIDFLRENGYETFYYKIQKLWYPHFLLIGRKSNCCCKK